jgi:hypothetical protein
MTMRQLVMEVMRKHGHSEEEIAERNAFASSMVPGLPVDREMAPETVEPMRTHLENLYQRCEADPDGHAEWIERKTAELIKKN